MAKLPRLTDMLKESDIFTDPEHEDYLSPPQQARILMQAEVFQSKTSNLYDDPDELAGNTLKGTPEQWEEFLNLLPVQLYITARTKNLATVGARKSMRSLQKSAAQGDVAASKYLNEISGILQAQSNNKMIILTCVPRPEVKR